MIEISDLLSVDRILCKCELKSKKRSLQTLSELLASNLETEEVSEMDILDALINREKLGSTGLGHGVALPHGRIKGLEAPMAALITLQAGVDFEAPDEAPVDLMVGLIVPENCADEHLNILASLAGSFSQPQLRSDLRSTSDAASALSLFPRSSPAGTESGNDTGSGPDSGPESSSEPDHDKNPEKPAAQGKS